MVDQIMKAPMFEQVLGSGPTPDRKALSVAFLSVDQKKFQIDFLPAAARATIATLSLGIGHLVQSGPPDVSEQMTALRGKAIQAGMSSAGGIALIVTLENDAEFAIDLPREVIASFAKMVAEMAAMASPVKN